MPLFPAFIKLQGRSVLVVGGGRIAESKIPALLNAGAKVRVIAPQITSQVGEWTRDGRIEWLPRPFAADDLIGVFLVIAATSQTAVNEQVYCAADRLGVLCNAVDDMEHCHFYYGAVVQRGDLQIAISSNGKSPALAQRLRKELEQQFEPEYAAWLEWLGCARDLARAQTVDAEATRSWLHLLASQPMFERFLQEHSNSQVHEHQIR